MFYTEGLSQNFLNGQLIQDLSYQFDDNRLKIDEDGKKMNLTRHDIESMLSTPVKENLLTRLKNIKKKMHMRLHPRTRRHRPKYHHRSHKRRSSRRSSRRKSTRKHSTRRKRGRSSRRSKRKHRHSRRRR